jgi:hypothetical protein
VSGEAARNKSTSSTLEAITRNADSQILDSIYMTLPSSMSYLDSCLPHSQSSDIAIDISAHDVSPLTAVDLENGIRESTSKCLDRRSRRVGR